MLVVLVFAVQKLIVVVVAACVVAVSVKMAEEALAISSPLFLLPLSRLDKIATK